LEHAQQIAAQFNAAAQNYSNILQPYAIKLFFSLLLIDIVVTYVQYTADQLEPMRYLGRVLRHLLGGGFVYAMILHGFIWMGWVIVSFGQLGQIISGIPSLSPGSIYATGSTLAATLMNSPTTAGLISSIELAFLEGFLALVVWGCFLFVAIELLMTLVRGGMTASVGIMTLSFGGSRFTSNIPEGYFTNIVRIGIKILFMYATLAIAMQIVMSLAASLKRPAILFPLRCRGSRVISLRRNRS
jgi:P-type conjugative transfer protein TrbL